LDIEVKYKQFSVESWQDRRLEQLHMSNPVLVEVTRGALIESRHTGAVAVVDADGTTVLSLGDVAQAVYPRSAVKAIQALALVESGAADRFGFGQEELALACASHGGEPGHVEVATRMLARSGLDKDALACGVHWPSHEDSKLALARTGGNPSALHNNCSGKHAGFVCTACQLGIDHRGYVAPEHPIQRMVKAALEDLSGVAILDENRAVDGCSVPTWAIPLHRLARAFARLAAGSGLGQERARAARRLMLACAEKPWFVAGTGRFCTAIMQHFGTRVFVKTGAEGVFCGALPDQGIGIALKCDDGGSRAAEAAMAAMIARFLPLRANDRTALEPYLHRVLHNWNGISVGAISPSKPLLDSPAGH
jgi:L-asparaginase II